MFKKMVAFAIIGIIILAPAARAMSPMPEREVDAKGLYTLFSNQKVLVQANKAVTSGFKLDRVTRVAHGMEGAAYIFRYSPVGEDTGLMRAASFVANVSHIAGRTVWSVERLQIAE